MLNRTMNARRAIGGALAAIILLFGVIAVYGVPSSAAAQRATLPPTWTPTFTATASRTPTITPSPTATATLNPETVCEDQFFVVDELGEGYYYEAYEYFPLLMGTELSNTSMRLYVYHRLSGEGIGIDIPPQEFTGVQLAIQQLPRSGLYDWELTLLDTEEEVLCSETGYFFAGDPAWVTPSPMPPTDPPPPQVIVVTATSEPETTAPPNITEPALGLRTLGTPTRYVRTPVDVITPQRAEVTPPVAATSVITPES